MYIHPPARKQPAKAKKQIESLREFADALKRYENYCKSKSGIIILEAITPQYEHIARVLCRFCDSRSVMLASENMKGAGRKHITEGGKMKIRKITVAAVAAA